jgi:hypothetical protein
MIALVTIQLVIDEFPGGIALYKTECDDHSLWGVVATYDITVRHCAKHVDYDSSYHDDVDDLRYEKLTEFQDDRLGAGQYRMLDHMALSGTVKELPGSEDFTSEQRRVLHSLRSELLMSKSRLVKMPGEFPSFLLGSPPGEDRQFAAFCMSLAAFRKEEAKQITTLLQPSGEGTGTDPARLLREFIESAKKKQEYLDFLYQKPFFAQKMLPTKVHTAFVRGRETQAREKAMKSIDMQHISRSFENTALEDACPCPQEPCGFVARNKIDPSCTEHPIMAAKTIRRMHTHEACSAIPVQNPKTLLAGDPMVPRPARASTSLLHKTILKQMSNPVANIWNDPKAMESLWADSRTHSTTISTKDTHTMKPDSSAVSIGAHHVISNSPTSTTGASTAFPRNSTGTMGPSTTRAAQGALKSPSDTFARTRLSRLRALAEKLRQDIIPEGQVFPKTKAAREELMRLMQVEATAVLAEQQVIANRLAFGTARRQDLILARMVAENDNDRDVIDEGIREWLYEGDGTVGYTHTADQQSVESTDQGSLAEIIAVAKTRRPIR